MNCWTMAIIFRLTIGGRLSMLKWPHMVVMLDEHHFIHWRADDESLPMWKWLHYKGKFDMQYAGPKYEVAKAA